MSRLGCPELGLAGSVSLLPYICVCVCVYICVETVAETTVVEMGASFIHPSIYTYIHTCIHIGSLNTVQKVACGLQGIEHLRPVFCVISNVIAHAAGICKSAQRRHHLLDKGFDVGELENLPEWPLA